MTCPKDTTETKAADIERLMRAINYMLTHPEMVATRANTQRVAKQFWVHPKSLQIAMRMLAEEGL